MHLIKHCFIEILYSVVGAYHLFSPLSATRFRGTPRNRTGRSYPSSSPRRLVRPPSLSVRQRCRPQRADCARPSGGGSAPIESGRWEGPLPGCTDIVRRPRAQGQGAPETARPPMSLEGPDGRDRVPRCARLRRRRGPIAAPPHGEGGRPGGDRCPPYLRLAHITAPNFEHRSGQYPMDEIRGRFQASARS